MNISMHTGRFTNAPRRQDTDKTSRCFFTLMVNKEGKKPDGTKYPAQAVDYVAWGKTADLICQYKNKGDLVLINSEFSTYEREPVDMNNQPIANARKVQRAIFTVRSIEFLSTPNSGNTQTQTSNNTSAANNNVAQNNANIESSDIPTYNSTDFATDLPNADGGLPFSMDDKDDPFQLSSL